MARSEHQKLKLLYLYQMLLHETDETHGLTIPEMIDRLAALGVSAERKSIYDDLAALETFGCDILAARQDRVCRYSLAHRAFELPELKLLVDAVQSSKFLSERKSRELIKKLEGLCSRYEAQSLQRQVYVAGRVKSMNESIYYSIDTIHSAISADRQISFTYFEWTMQKTARFRHEGARYRVSPCALVWDDENYYLVAYDARAGGIRHYRADKMAAIAVEDAPREGKALFESLDPGTYAKKRFGMFGGEETELTLLFASRLAGAVIDRFGKDASTVPADDDHFRLYVRAVVSPQFMGWVAGFGSEVKILAPAFVAADFAAFCRKICEQYS